MIKLTLILATAAASTLTGAATLPPPQAVDINAGPIAVSTSVDGTKLRANTTSDISVSVLTRAGRTITIRF